jgi:hypothetical protein
MRQHKSESHQRDSSANPGQKRSLFGKIMPQVSGRILFGSISHVSASADVNDCPAR